MKELRIPIDPVRILENLEVSDEVPDDEADQHQTRDGHQDFASNRGSKESAEEGHWGN